MFMPALAQSDKVSVLKAVLDVGAGTSVYSLLPIHHLESHFLSHKKGWLLSPFLLHLLVKIRTQLLTLVFGGCDAQGNYLNDFGYYWPAYNRSVTMTEQQWSGFGHDRYQDWFQ
jgi:hypothetical protein